MNDISRVVNSVDDLTKFDIITVLTNKDIPTGLASSYFTLEKELSFKVNDHIIMLTVEDGEYENGANYFKVVLGENLIINKNHYSIAESIVNVFKKNDNDNNLICKEIKILLNKGVITLGKDLCVLVDDGNVGTLAGMFSFLEGRIYVDNLRDEGDHKLYTHIPLDICLIETKKQLDDYFNLEITMDKNNV